MLVRSLPAIIGLVLLTPWAYAKEPAFETRAGAIRGYDAVAYFTQNKPVKGNDRYSLDGNGATWYFASTENRNRFKADPAKYAPRYGGYRAWAVANGYRLHRARGLEYRQRQEDTL